MRPSHHQHTHVSLCGICNVCASIRFANSEMCEEDRGKKKKNKTKTKCLNALVFLAQRKRWCIDVSISCMRTDGVESAWCIRWKAIFRPERVHCANISLPMQWPNKNVWKRNCCCYCCRCYFRIPFRRFSLVPSSSVCGALLSVSP